MKCTCFSDIKSYCLYFLEGTDVCGMKHDLAIG